LEIPKREPLALRKLLYLRSVVILGAGMVKFGRFPSHEIRGKIPVNPKGGLLSRGHPVGATGLAQTAEIT